VQSVFGSNYAAQHLFFHMAPADQQHAVAVARTLSQAGQKDSVLLQAALLHDVAKSLSQPLLYRVAVVLLQIFSPRILARLASAPLTCAVWRRPFVVSVHHPQVGAAWAAEVGCSALTVRLIRFHQVRPAQKPGNRFEELQALLYKADNQN
jgi:HD superfamily phosphohydrolase YqeK